MCDELRLDRVSCASLWLREDLWQSWRVMRHQARIIRDPIHGDVLIGTLQMAVIDTPVFQRLRYIRQNGLLHFVFPGAVHTRFSHSIGTMHVARRAFSVLFPEYRPHKPDTEDPAFYVGQIFELAALLHDIGHCAFSHSLEKVRLAGDRPIFPPVDDIVKTWDDDTLTAWWERQGTTYKRPKETEHEQVGMLLTHMLFRGEDERVGAACAATLGQEPSTIAQDVLALLHRKHGIDPSEKFRSCAAAIAAGVESPERVEKPDEDLIQALSTLISGSLDVDRMDYLQRDSLFTGTTYGICDTDILVGSLVLGVAEDGHLQLGLRSRAVQAADDFMWSRFQLFLQVLNHKTNVILNELLRDALPEVLGQSDVPLQEPKSFKDYLDFTDDRVMASVRSACIYQAGGDQTTYARALFRRKFPLYLGARPLTGSADDSADLRDHRRELAKEHLGSTDRFTEIRFSTVKSDLVKGGGLPFVQVRDRATGETFLREPGAEQTYKVNEWTKNGDLPITVEEVHFFVDRQCVAKP